MGCIRVLRAGEREVMMPFSSALVRHVWEALASSGLPGRNQQVPLWQRGANSLAGSK